MENPEHVRDASDPERSATRAGIRPLVRAPTVRQAYFYFRLGEEEKYTQ